MLGKQKSAFMETTPRQTPRGGGAAAAAALKEQRNVSKETEADRIRAEANSILATQGVSPENSQLAWAEETEVKPIPSNLSAMLYSSTLTLKRPQIQISLGGALGPSASTRNAAKRIRPQSATTYSSHSRSRSATLRPSSAALMSLGAETSRVVPPQVRAAGSSDAKKSSDVREFLLQRRQAISHHNRNLQAAASVSEKSEPTKPQASAAATSIRDESAPSVNEDIKDPSVFIEWVKENPESFDFVYLRYKFNRWRYNSVYDLEICPFSETNTQDYFTLSSQGLTRFQDMAASDFEPLNDYIKNQENFNKLRNFKYFTEFRKRKIFTGWKEYVRGSRYFFAREAIKRKLLPNIDEVIAAALVSVREETVWMDKVQMLEMKDDMGYTPEELCNEIRERNRKFTLPRLRTSIEKIIKVTVRACQVVCEKHGGLVVQPDMSNEALNALRRLKYFIKLVDYMLCNSLFELPKNAIKLFEFMVLGEPVNLGKVLETSLVAGKMLGAFKKATRKAVKKMEEKVENTPVEWTFPGRNVSVPVFRVLLRISRGKIMADPHEQQFLFAIQDLIYETMDGVSSLPSVLGEDNLKTYIQAFSTPFERRDFEESPDIKTMLVQDKEFTDTVIETRERIQEAMDQVKQRYCLYDKYMNWLYDPKTFLDLTNMYLDDEGHMPSLESIKASWGTLSRGRKDLNKLSQPFQLGCFKIHCVFAQDDIMAVVNKAEKFLTEQITFFMRTAADADIQIVTKATELLDRPPDNLEQFVQWMEMLEYIDRSEEGLATTTIGEKHIELNCLRDFMVESEIAFTNDDKDKCVRANVLYDGLKVSISRAMRMREDTSLFFKKQLLDRLNIIKAEIEEVEQEAHHPMIRQLFSDPDFVLEHLAIQQDRLNNLRERYHDCQHIMELIGKELPDSEELEAVCEDVTNKELLWENRVAWDKTHTGWMATALINIDMEQVTSVTESYFKLLMRLAKVIPHNAVAEDLKDRITKFRSLLSLISCFTNPALKDRHWKKLREILEIPNEQLIDISFTLELLMEYDIMLWRKEITEISEAATMEAELENQLLEISERWSNIEFRVITYKDQKDRFILGGAEKILTQMEDDQMSLAAMQCSPFRAPIQEDLDDWQDNLNTLGGVIDRWFKVQRKWIYLEPIFTSPDIVRQMPDESRLFNNVDKSWRGLMKDTYLLPNAMAACLAPGLDLSLEKWDSILDKVQKMLENFLEMKRSLFPRFYFLSNDELLAILSRTRVPQSVQPHLLKLFDNIDDFKFGKKEGDRGMSDLYADGMVSAEGEYVAFNKAVKIRGPVEQWLTGAEQAMKATLKEMMKTGYINYPRKKRSQWILEHPAQVILAISQLYWAAEVVQCLDKAGFKQDLLKLVESIQENLNDMAKMARGNLKKLERGVIEALIVLDVHCRDVTIQLEKNNTSLSEDFAWIRQLRYVWNQDEDDLSIQQSLAVFEYGYEYLGCTPRLVITPLTDRCYLTLTGALYLNLGGAPEGPAGTGKTETTKDLGKALGKQCVVFNCSEGLDYQMMGQFFSGLAQTGAWACFDEFNRIDVEVLSVIAQQILTIQKAIKARQSLFTFEGRKIKLNPTCGVFITMNPGYAGRTELPDNLKALFRPVAMMIPDYELISEVILFSQGFTEAKVLAGKVVRLYKLSSEQLSHQDHYDFGMRAVKSVLVMAGALRRNRPLLREHCVLILALCNANIPKFLAEDVALFNSIVHDLFPDDEKPVEEHEKLINIIEEYYDMNGFTHVPSLTTKVLQLYDTMQVRHGVMLVGPAMSGKSTVYNALAHGLTELTRASFDSADDIKPPMGLVNCHVLNPKAITMGELYGQFSEVSHEWTDGLTAILTRKAVAIEDPLQRTWIVFDGPVDAVWIENMNSVLDDNKKLCLANGERITLSRSMFMMFEVRDLQYASPATVSRCGMVYVSSNDVGWKPIVQSWISRLQDREEERYSWALYNNEFVEELLMETLETCFTWLRSGMTTELVASVDQNLATSICLLFQYICDEKIDVMPHPSTKDRQRYLSQILLFCLPWTVGGNLTDDGKQKFDNFLREKLSSLGALPPRGSMYDYFMDPETNTFVSWDRLLTEFEVNDSMRGNPETWIVPTVDTQRYGYIMEACLFNHRSLLIIGESGVGKTALMKSLVASECAGHNKNTTSSYVIFSGQTSSANAQGAIENKLDVRGKADSGVLKPFDGKRMLICLDDVNMPKPEKYSAIPVIELMRQFMDRSGWYDLNSLEWTPIEDVGMYGCMGPPGGGRNEITTRFTRHFHLLYMTDPSIDALTTIFNGIMFQGLAHGSNDKAIREIKANIVTASVILYDSIKSNLLPTPQKPHYTFNLRDIWRVFMGMLQTSDQKKVTKDSLLRLWVHETLRVYADRMVNDEDREILRVELCDRLSQNMKVRKEVEHIEEYGGMFGDFIMNDGMRAHMRTYAPIPEKTDLKRLYREYLDDYNREHTPLELVFFQDCIVNIARITRVLRQPRSNALLLGMDGFGRRTCARFATHMCSYNLFELRVTKFYKMSDFHDDLRNMCMQAGVDGVPVVLLINDQQFVHSAMLEDVNNLLNNGEVPGLFESADKLEQVMKGLQMQEELRGKIPTKKHQLYDFFIGRVRQNLHIVISMSPVGDNFRTNVLLFPSIVNCCTILWFRNWQTDALVEASDHFMRDADISNRTIQKSVAHCCVEIHRSITGDGAAAQRFRSETGRVYYITPSHYLQFMKSYQYLLSTRRLDIRVDQTRLESGIGKLDEVNAEVEEMRKELLEIEPYLEETKKEVALTEERLEREGKGVEEFKSVLVVESAKVKKQTDMALAVFEEAHRDLAEAMPALTAAEEALNNLSREHIVEMKSYSKPPELVVLVMESICIVHQVTPNWNNAKILLNDPKQFLNDLIAYDRENIPKSVIVALERYVRHPDYQVSKIERVSIAAMSLCQWVHAIVKFYKVFQVVGPKRERARVAQAEADAAQAELEAKEAQLRAVEKKIEDLQNTLDETRKRKDDLVARLEDCKFRLDRAHRLVSGLSGEKERWTNVIKTLDTRSARLVGDMLIAAAALTYLGPLTANFRQELLDTWWLIVDSEELNRTPDADLIEILGDPMQILDWNVDGLPSDEYSVQNGIMSNQTVKYPLMIDPQGQIHRWIRNRFPVEKEKNDPRPLMKIVRVTEPDYLQTIEQCVEFGHVCLIEHLDDSAFDSSLDPLVFKETYRKAGKNMIRIGEKEVIFHRDFRLFMTTKHDNPHFMPTIFVKVGVINCNVTPYGLEQQLLQHVVKIEKPDLEEMREELVIGISADKKELRDLENQILAMVSSVKGDLLENLQLITTLEDSSATAVTIKERVEQAEITEAQISDARKAYTPVARRGSILFFSLKPLVDVNPMYQYSLDFFIRLFSNTVLKHKDGKSNEEIRPKSEISITLEEEATEKPSTEISAEAKPGDNAAKEGCTDDGSTSVKPVGKATSQMDLIASSLNLLGDAANAANDADDFADHLETLQNLLTEATYSNISRGLFDIHKSVFAFYIGTNMFREKGEITEKEWEFFLRGAPSILKIKKDASKIEWDFLTDDKQDDKSSEDDMDEPPASWIKQSMWDDLCYLEENFSAFNGLRQEIMEEGYEWSQFLYADNPETVPCPGGWATKLSPWHLLLLYKSLSPSLAVQYIPKWIQEEMGPIFVEKKSFDMDWCLQNSSPDTPVLFVLSPGTDPSDNLIRLSEEMRPKDPMAICSLGQGQGEVAERLIKKSIRLGVWVLLQNCHLAGSWLPTLESIVEEVAASQPHSKFRLFLTSQPTSVMPISLLQTCVKVTNEAPKGIRNHMKHNYSILNSAVHDHACEGNNLIWKRFVYATSVFHAIIQERRRFGPIGWNSKYDFSDADMQVSLANIRQFLTDAEETPFDALNYLTAEINYGGRVTDQWDRRLIVTILQKYYRPAIIEQGHSLIDGDLTYKLPAKPTYDNVTEWIDTLPSVDSADIFGLDGNATTSALARDGRAFVNTLTQMEIHSATADGVEDQVINTVDRFLHELPKPIDLESQDVHHKTFAPLPNGSLNSLANFLRHEVARMNRLIDAVGKSLRELKQAMCGKVVMSMDMEKTLHALRYNQVPTAWSFFAYPSLKPLMSWFSDLIDRVNALEQWKVRGPPGMFWLCGFFFPQGFLTSVLQNHSRMAELPVDRFSFDFKVMDNISMMKESHDVSPPETGVYVSRLFLEGATWENHGLAVAEHGVLFHKMQPIHFIPVADFTPRKENYACPLYKISSRAGTLSTTGHSTNFIVTIYLPIPKHFTPSFWVLRSTALLGSLDD